MTHKSKIRLFSGWRTQWCVELPVDDEGCAQFDKATYERRLWPTMEAATAYAQSIVDGPQKGGEFGCVTIDEFRYVPDDQFPNLYDFELVGADTVEVTR